MDSPEKSSTQDDVLTYTADIVSAYVGNNQIGREALANLIAEVHGALSSAAGAQTTAEPEPLVPAVPVKKSITDGHIVCLECGKQQKSLKRHLRTAHDLTPDEYRSRWGLPRDYPMVAAEYRARRSELARSIGLGRRPSAPEPMPAPAPEPAAPKRRGRKAAAA